MNMPLPTGAALYYRKENERHSNLGLKESSASLHSLCVYME